MKVLRRGTALVLSLALMFSLVAVVASPNWSKTTSWGKLSRYYETGNIDDEAAAGMISTVAGDPGGKSYGAYMFASKAGTVKEFINWCLNSNKANTATYAIGEKLYRAYYSGGEGCGPLFDQAWLELADDDEAAFFTAQENFVKSKIYDEAIREIRKTYATFNINHYSVALKNVIWSRAVHHGPSGAASIVKDAFASLGGFANQAEADLIMAIYAQSGKVVDSYNGADKMSGSLADKYNVDGKVLRYWYGSSSGVQLAVYRRLNVNEPADALSMLQSNAYPEKALRDGNYTVTVKKDSSSLALGVVDKSIKVINTADKKAGTAAKFTLNYLSGVGAYTINTTVGKTTMRLAASSADGSGFGTVTLATPSTSDSQLWYIDNGQVKNKATGTYLAYRNDTLVVVGSDGANMTQTVTAAAASGDKKQTFTHPSPATPSNLPKKLTVTFATGDMGSLASGSTASFEPGTSSGFVAKKLHTVSTKTGWNFVGWFTQDGKEIKANSTVAAGNLTLYARYTTTAKVKPAAWTFSSVVKDAADISVHQLIYPDKNTELHEGDSSFPVRGMISCSGKITNVNLSIVGSSINVSASPNSSFYDLSNLDSRVSYSSLKEGNYTYKLTAKVGGTTYTLKESKFSVDERVAPDVSTPSVGDKFTVTFDAGTNGTSEYTSKTYALDSIVYGTLPSVKVKSSSVEFVGWFTADGVQVLPGTQIAAENITLYARYTNEYTYTFLKANSGIYRSGSAAAGTLFTAPTTAPSKAPDSNYTYSFSHWVDANGNKYSSGQAIVMGEGDMTFTPVYTKKEVSDSSGDGDSSTTTPSGTVWTISPGTSVDEMDSPVYSGGKVVTSGTLATGMTTTVDGKEYILSVTGDISGDGNISVTDVVKLQSHLLNKASLSGAYLEAADLNGDGKVTITDLVKSARVVAGKDTIS